MAALGAMNRCRDLGPLWVPFALLGCLCGVACTDTSRGGAAPATTLSMPVEATLAVIGVQRDQQSASETARSQDRRVGFGLNNLLAEALFSSGKFRLIEEKEVRQRDLLEELVLTYWVTPRGAYSELELARVAQQLGVATLAYGRVASRASREERFELGPLSRAKQQLRIQATACLYAVAQHSTLCRTGEGEAQQEKTSLVFELRDDYVDFEKNAAGRATKQAVALAVQALITSLQFSP